MKTDLHLHSLFSDGLLRPEELCRAARKEGVTHLSLTDHDNADGAEAMASAARENGIRFLPGAEVSSGAGGHMHVLLYGHIEDPRVSAFLEMIRGGRQSRARKILVLLREKEGIELSPAAVARLDCPNVGRAHIARELIGAGIVNTMDQAFERYLGNGRSCYVPHGLQSLTETVKAASFLPVTIVLAHPMEIGLKETETLSLIESLTDCGLNGVEAYHPSASVKQGRVLADFARNHSLLVTGGSDYHGDVGSRTRIGSTGHPWPAMEQDTEALFDFCGEWEEDT